PEALVRPRERRSLQDRGWEEDEPVRHAKPATARTGPRPESWKPSDLRGRHRSGTKTIRHRGGDHRLRLAAESAWNGGGHGPRDRTWVALRGSRRTRGGARGRAGGEPHLRAAPRQPRAGGSRARGALPQASAQRPATARRGARDRRLSPRGRTA